MKKYILFLGIFLIVASAWSQVGIFAKADLIKYTPKWTGERFEDGRPKVSDDLLQRMKEVSIEEAWAVCNRHGFMNQFEGNWVMTEDEPVLVGRAVTACFQPRRPDVDSVITARRAGARRPRGDRLFPAAATGCRFGDYRAGQSGRPHRRTKFLDH